MYRGAALVVFAAGLAEGQTLSLAWAANLEADVAGYRLHYGTASGVYTRCLDAGNTTSATINIEEDTIYFFAVTAYNAARIESLPSHEIAYPSPDQLRKISIRGSTYFDGMLVSAFVISGSGQKNILLRALGPSAPFPSGLSDPIIELYDGNGSIIAKNNNWATSQKEAILATGLAPTNYQDAALIATLDAGSYSVVLRDANDVTGIGFVEIYDLDNSRETVRLSNSSQRGSVLTDDKLLIGGFIVRGGDWQTTIVVRALGPSLTQLEVPYTLADPTLELRDGNGALIAANDNWKDTQQEEIQAAGMAPSNARESAILITPPPGNYIAIVAAENGGTGIAAIEIFDLN